MLEAADAEGAIWRAFVACWWESLQSGPAGVGDLYKVAVLSEPPMPLGDGNERSQKTRLGKALGRMRDRVFHVGPSALRIASAGIRHQAQQWQLVHEGDAAPAGERGVPNAQRSPTRSPKETEARQRDGEGGERWERSPTPLEDLEKDYAY
jgi:putative DNA primase/helicase